MASFAAAAPSAEESNPGWIDGPAPPADYEKRSDERLDALTRRGFGCPFDKYQCNDHVSEFHSATVDERWGGRRQEANDFE